MSEKNDTILGAFLSDYTQKLHVREIARLSGLNRQTASDTLKQMEKIRILDSEVLGRQKFYFISGSLKSKLHVERAENLRRLQVCGRSSLLTRLIDYIDGTTILFGSYAKGLERQESDIDIIVISGKKQNFENFEKETGKSVQAFHMDKKEFVKRLHAKDTMVIEAVRYHVCLKNVEDFVDIMWDALYGKRN